MNKKDGDATLKSDIQKGIDVGVELSRDDGIEFEIKECQTNNGNSSRIDEYRSQLHQNKLNKINKQIINKYA